MRRTIVLAMVIAALSGCMGLHDGVGHGGERASGGSSHQH